MSLTDTRGYAIGMAEPTLVGVAGPTFCGGIDGGGGLTPRVAASIREKPLMNKVVETTINIKITTTRKAASRKLDITGSRKKTDRNATYTERNRAS